MYKLSSGAWRSLLTVLVFLLVVAGVLVPASPVAAATNPMVAAGLFHTVGLKSDGTVVAVGDNSKGQCNVSLWTDIIQVAAAEEHTVGTRSDGTAVAVGRNFEGQCNIGSWTGIIQVAAGLWHTIGLKCDGTVVATGANSDGQCDVGLWTGIIQVAAGQLHTVGLKADGTVVATGKNDCGQCNVSSWTNIVQVAAGSYHTVGLRSDGTVVAVGETVHGQCNVDSWEHIVQVAAGSWHTVGLRSDGTVVAAGQNNSGQCNISWWTDIIQVAAFTYHTVGLKSDGTVVAVGRNLEGQCNVSGWNLGPQHFPRVIGDYATVCSIKFFDWRCNKLAPVTAGTLHITYQDNCGIRGYWEPDMVPQGWPPLVPVKGYVGAFVRDDKGKVRNTPRLSLLLEVGRHWQYPTTKYVTYVLNGKVKWDKKLNTVKSIKGSIIGWGEYGDYDWVLPITPNEGQFEGKFTATPLAEGSGMTPGKSELPLYQRATTKETADQPGLLPQEEIPSVEGDYLVTGSVKFYDWLCHRLTPVQSGTLHITKQEKHEVIGYLELPDTAWPDIVAMRGYVGRVQRQDGKIKNTPRISLMLELGNFYGSPCSSYITYIINGKIKLDKETGQVKSIKCTVGGWGKWGTGGLPAGGQFEGKFTATPPTP